MSSILLMFFLNILINYFGLSFNTALRLFLVIEHLPQELRDRFTEMREMDLGVQSKFKIFLTIFFCNIFIIFGKNIYNVKMFPTTTSTILFEEIFLEKNCF